jgi:hypothetical protein
VSKRGEINGWLCQKCKCHTYAVHVDDGVTPFYLACRADGRDPRDPESDCDGVGQSLFYPAPPAPDHVIAAVKWEWYMPVDPPEDAAAAEHVRKGGLLLRELTDAGRAALAMQGVPA